jgi:G patch domain-containing protein 1
VSSRTNRVNAQQRVEDFMDDEDMAEVEEARTLQTASGFGGPGAEGASGNALVDVMRPSADESMGVKLLQRMGWRQGQGVGPKIRRKARGDDEDDVDGQEHLFAPDNSAMIQFNKKSDFKGLGYAGELSLSRTLGNSQSKQADEDNEDDDEAAWNRPKLKKAKPKLKPSKKPSFGVGVLNDTGSDDDDPYELGPKISYNRTIGGSDTIKKSKKKPAVVGGANPLLASRPVFTKKNITGKPVSSSAGFRKCHDGRLPLDGFVLAMQTLDISPLAKYPPPTIPAEWKAKRSRWDVKPAEDYTSTTEAAKSSTLDPKSRAAALGEEALPGKSIFDYITPAARDKLASASGRSDLPQAKGEDAPAAYRLSEDDRQKQLWSLVPELGKHVALEALQRGASGWMPYADDSGKRSRYRAFLELRAGIAPTQTLPQRAQGTSKDDWVTELREFAQAAAVFRPITGAMASRFTTSRSTPSGTATPTDPAELLTKPEPKPEDPAEAAAKIGMYGHLTRSVLPFHPTRLLCKRFNVRPPAGVALDPRADPEGASERREAKEMVPKKAIERMMQDAALRRFESRGYEGGTSDQSGHGTIEEEDAQVEMPEVPVVDAERNEALEVERPGDAVFRAVFGSDNEDD